MSDETEHIWIEQVGAIAVREPSEAEIHQRELNAAAADAMHTPEELQAGMYHELSDVRQRVVARLIARGADDPSTIPTLLDVLQHDPSPAVRGRVAFSLVRFPDDARVVAALETSARTDVDSEVREDARYGLTGFV